MSNAEESVLVTDPQGLVCKSKSQNKVWDLLFDIFFKIYYLGLVAMNGACLKDWPVRECLVRWTLMEIHAGIL